MKGIDGMFSSSTAEWATPIEFFNTINREFAFDLDVCATKENAKCSMFYSESDNGLMQEWKGVCWCNPPYGRSIGTWIKKAWESSLSGATVVCLIPARTDTNWWHDCVAKASEVRFIKGRLYFNDGKGRAPFPSCLVIFKPQMTEAK